MVLGDLIPEKSSQPSISLSRKDALEVNPFGVSEPLRRQPSGSSFQTITVFWNIPRS